MTKNLCADVCYSSLNKKNEELCGDRVQIVRDDASSLLVLSDGLGSGVKANILATLTSKIISTMISEGASVEDTVDTIAHTLPVCKERHIAYSTFMILKIFDDGQAYLAEYDNPPCICIRDGKLMNFFYDEKTIAGKPVRESRFEARAGDYFIIVSDGVTQAGMGETLSFGWGWENVVSYVADFCALGLSAPRLIRKILSVGYDLYQGKPGDDTTVSVLHLLPKQEVAFYSGPPKKPEDDSRVVTDFMSQSGIHVVSGGTSSEIVARELGKKLEVSVGDDDSDIPPMSAIAGIDLVTEGVMTLKAVLEMLDRYIKEPTSREMANLLDGKDGAAALARILIERCTDLHLFIGKAINPAHQNNDFPTELRLKFRLLDDIAERMSQLGRNVEKKYY